MTELSLSQQIRQESQDAWDRMQQSRFVTDIENDRLNLDVFKRYLAFENQFVETAIVIFGYLLVKAPNLETRQRLVKILEALSGDQIAYFRNAFVALGMEEAEWKGIYAPPPVAAFRDGMLLAAAHGTYIEGIAVMFAAESMYFTWCDRAAQKTVTNPELRHWVDLHAAPDFRAQAEWLRVQIDEAGHSMTAEARTSVRLIFQHALELEIGFHDAAYE